MKSIYKAGALIIKNKKLLVVREKGEDFFINPGGKIEENETPEETLKRELKEELGIDANKISFFDTIKYDFPDMLFKMETYFVEVDEEITLNSEIEEFKWINSYFKNEGIEIAEDIEKQQIPRLIKMGLIE